MLKQTILEILVSRFGIPAAWRMMRQTNKKHTNDKIRIVFMCHLPQIWTCLQSVYEAACQCDEIEPFILTIPEHFEEQNVSKDAYHYMVERGYSVIDAYDEETKEFFDLKKLQPDYIFIPRPYDWYLPLQYQSKELSKYSKVCYVEYGYLSEGKNMVQVCFDRCFSVNCYMIFAENETVEKYIKRLFPITSKLGIRKVIKTPYPRFDLTRKYDGIHGSGWNRSKEECNKRIIWTPRWTLDPELGGTSFFDYKDFLFSYAKKHPEDDFLFRPHPMAFDNFVKVGAMTEEYVQIFKDECLNAVNIALDTNKEHLDNFTSADILISDLSGVVVDFAVTGKPIIYCNSHYPLNDSCKELLDAYYVVKNAAELEETLTMLCNGEDKKAVQRKEIVERVLGKNDGKNGERIIHYILDDYNRKGR